MIRVQFTILLISLAMLSAAQERISVAGILKTSEGTPISEAAIRISDDQGTTTNEDGRFSILVIPKDSILISFSHLSFLEMDTVILGAEDIFLEITLSTKTQVLESLEIEAGDDIESMEQNAYSIDEVSARNLPSAFGDFNKVLATMPGVSGNNELSSAYSVRGGNFDENLVYVNDIPIYRPFLANSGRQEGLSFVNPDLVGDIKFYSGGWQAKYGDKLSSSLNIEYKELDSLRGGISLGLLGGTGYFGGGTADQRFNYLAGIRHRDSRYLLNTLEVDGQYFPRFTDVQSLLSWDLTKRSSTYRNRTKLDWLISYGRNRYQTFPTSQLTEFGSVTRNFRLQTAFVGQELLTYDTWQSGVKVSHWFNPKFRSSLIISSVYTIENEDYEVEGAYRLCDVDNNPASGTFDHCVITRGIGSQLDYGRNDLNAFLTTVENRHELLVSENSVIEFGIGIRNQIIEDNIREYSFKDSADYINVTEVVDNALELSNQHFYGYVQLQYHSSDSLQELNIGVRTNHWTETGETLVSPRLLYRIKPRLSRPTYFSFSAGSYGQHPFYRELRTYGGELRTELKAQKSYHLITGFERYMLIWDRPFSLSIQGYYKFLRDIIPYDVDNLRLRYQALNNASGYATGLDARINGEFVRGTQSWFSLSLLKTEEDIANDGLSSVRRPLDQRINLGIYFEDHLPLDPTTRVYLHGNFGSGYPFGPPQNQALRNAFSGDEYYRIDIGFSKDFRLRRVSLLDLLAIKLEILNALGADNTLSYTWIEDVNGTSFAIPNSLSARFFNLKLIAGF